MVVSCFVLFVNASVIKGYYSKIHLKCYYFPTVIKYVCILMFEKDFNNDDKKERSHSKSKREKEKVDLIFLRF